MNIRIPGWLLLLMVIAAAAAAEQITQGKDGLFLGESFEEKLQLAAGQRLIINAANSLAGEIAVSAGSPEGRMVYQKSMKTPTRVDAEAFAEAITVEISRQKDDVVVLLRAPARAPWAGTSNWGRLNVQIFIPDSSKVEVNTSYFDLDVIGPFTGVTVTESLSRVRVERVHGAVDIKVSNRPLMVTDVTGSLSLTNKYSRIKAEKIDTGDEFGTIRNENGEVTIDGYRGGLDLRTSYNRIVAQNLFLTGSRNRIRNISAPISLSFDSIIGGQMRINNQYAQVVMDINGRTDAAFVCKIGESGKILADRLDMEPTLVYDNRMEFGVGDGTAEVRITARGDGDIIITGPEK